MRRAIVIERGCRWESSPRWWCRRRTLFSSVGTLAAAWPSRHTITSATRGSGFVALIGDGMHREGTFRLLTTMCSSASKERPRPLIRPPRKVTDGAGASTKFLAGKLGLDRAKKFASELREASSHHEQWFPRSVPGSASRRGYGASPLRARRIDSSPWRPE